MVVEKPRTSSCCRTTIVVLYLRTKIKRFFGIGYKRWILYGHWSLKKPYHVTINDVCVASLKDLVEVNHMVLPLNDTKTFEGFMILKVPQKTQRESSLAMKKKVLYFFSWEIKSKEHCCGNWLDEQLPVLKFLQPLPVKKPYHLTASNDVCVASFPDYSRKATIQTYVEVILKYFH